MSAVTPDNAGLIGAGYAAGGKMHPVFRNPLADKVSSSNSKQHTPCGVFEMEFWKCMHAFGAPLGRRYCDLERRDLRECVYQTKSLKRYWTVRQERMKEFAKGNLDEPFLKNYPAMDHAIPEHFDYCKRPAD